MTRPIPIPIEAARAAATPANDGDLQAYELRSLNIARTFTRAVKAAPEYSLVDYIRSRVPGMHVQDAQGLERVHEISRLAAQMGGTHADGAWVPPQVLAGTRDLDLTSGANAVGASYGQTLVPGVLPQHGLLSRATIITGLSGNSFALPAIGNAVDPTAGWTSDGSGAQTEPTFKVAPAVTPKALNIEMVVSRRLLLMSAVRSLEADLRAHLLRRVYDALDRVLVAGNGTTEPLGVLNDASVPTLAIGTNGGALTWARICDAEEAPALVAGEMLRPQWVMHPTLRKKLRQTLDPAGDLVLPGNTLLDVPVAVSIAMPTNLTKGTGTALTGLIYGDAAEVLLGMWGGGIDLMVDPYKYASRGAIRIIARVEVGTVVRRPGALVRTLDINPA